MNEKFPKIIVIEDNEDIISMIKMMLEMKHYEVFLRMNTDNILGFIKEIQPHLIIMDMLLSGGDGREICKSLKQNPELSHIPVLMISAHPNAKEQCALAGANFFLSKPFDIQEFYQTIE
ncbi:MAG: response regulator, partial [Ginsengibacter sp.]